MTDYTSVHIIKDHYFERETRNNTFNAHSSYEELYQIEELQEKRDCITLDIFCSYNDDAKRIHIVALDFEWILSKIKNYKEIFLSESVDFNLSYHYQGITKEIFSNKGYTELKNSNGNKSLKDEFKKLEGIERFNIILHSPEEIGSFINEKSHLQ